MRRVSLVALAVLGGLATAAPPALASKTVDVPATFRTLLPKVRMKTSVPILLPASLKLDFDRGQHLYRAATGRKSGYELELSAVPECRGANACFAATFMASRGAKLGSASNVTLAHGAKGHYQPLSCGASCAPPSIAWTLNGVRYEIQARALPGKRADMVAAANSAIRAGGR